MAKQKIALTAALGLALLAGPSGSTPGADPVSALKAHDIHQAIDISADRLEVRTKDNVAVFEGRVEAVQEDLKLQADRVVVHYQTRSAPAGAGDRPPAIARIDATGNVRLSSPSENVAGNWGVYDMEEKIVTLGGSVILTRGQAVVRGDRLQVDLKSGVTKLETADAGTGGESGRVRGRFVPAEPKQ